MHNLRQGAHTHTCARAHRGARMRWLEPEQIFIMPPAAPPATSLLSLFIVTFRRPSSTSCCHTERSHTGNAASYQETMRVLPAVA